MPTVKPRLVVVLEPHQAEVIRRLAAIEGRPMSTVVRQLIDQVTPTLIDVVAALEAAQEAKGKPAAQLLSAMSRLQASVQSATEKAVDQADMFTGKMHRTIAKVKAKAKAGARAKPAKPK